MKIQLDQEGYNPRKGGLIILQCFVVFFFFLFVLRFWYLQIHRGESFSKQALDNRLRHERVYATRGVISDRHGKLLAENRTAFGLSLIREDCSDIPTTLAQVSEWTKLPLDRLTAKYQQDRLKVKPFEPVLLLSDIPFDLVVKIEAQLLFWPGLQIVTRSKRAYPYADTFAHILGYVAEANERELNNNKDISLGDTIGKQGIELVLEEDLKGNKGLYSVDVDVLGRSLGRAMVEPPKPGENISLNIDAELQQSIREILGEQTGSAVVIEPETGKVLALVTTPAYDNNIFTGGLSQKDWVSLRDNPKYPLQNRGIQSVYPPGSVWKLMMIGLFLKQGINPQTTVFCSGETKLGNQTFRCWRRGGHGTVNMKRSLVESCDVYFYQVSERIGIDAIEKFAKSCGFGSPTGIELPYEKSGLVPSKAWKRRRFGERWQRGETLNVSIGQGFTLTTPLQVAVFVGALLNGGKIMEPQIISGKEPVIKSSIPINEQGRKMLVDSMQETVESPSGTAKVLRQENAIIGGKTGTAQVVKLRMVGERRLKTSETTYYERDHAWIASWGVRNNKKVVIVAMIEHGGGGSSVAGPVVKKIYDAMYAIDDKHNNVNAISMSTP